MMTDAKKFEEANRDAIPLMAVEFIGDDNAGFAQTFALNLRHIITDGATGKKYRPVKVVLEEVR